MQENNCADLTGNFTVVAEGNFSIDYFLNMK